MLNCDACQLLMADRLYEELESSVENEFQLHVENCSSCHSMMSELSSAKAVLQESAVADIRFDDIPERAALDAIWSKVEPELDKIDAERYRQLPKNGMPSFAKFAIGLAASVIISVSMVFYLQDRSDTAPAMALNNFVNPELMSYLDRAQVMLLLVANVESDTLSAVPIPHSFARDMAFEANLLNTSMDNSSSSGQRKLLKDIEFLLLQIANLNDANMEQGVALLQQYLEESSVLFKIRLLEMREQLTIEDRIDATQQSTLI